MAPNEMIAIHHQHRAWSFSIIERFLRFENTFGPQTHQFLQEEARTEARKARAWANGDPVTGDFTDDRDTP